MNSYTKQKVVKRYAVEVAGPCLVEGQFEEFQMLTEHLTVVAPSQTLDLVAEADEKSPAGVWIHEEASNVLARARAEAEGILLDARIEAERILQEARDGVVQERDGLERAIRAEIIPRAQQEGYRQGLAEGEKLVRERQQELDRVIQLAEAALRTEYDKADEMLLHLAVKIAERVVHSVLSVEPRLLLDIARSLVLLPQEREHSVLHVSREDGVWLNSLEPEVLPCPWVSDETLKTGECFLECEDGIFDARLETQLEKLEKALREELQHGELGAAGRES